MLDLLLGLLAASTPTTVPTVTSVTVHSTQSGACQIDSDIPLSEAEYEVTTVIANADWTNFVVKLYENGVLVQTFTGTPLVYDVTVSGRTESGTVDRAPANKTYRADVVHTANSQVVSSKSSAQWTQQYGRCFSRFGGGG